MGGQTGKIPLTAEQRVLVEEFYQRQDEIRDALRSSMTEEELDELFVRTRYILENDGFDIEEYTRFRYDKSITFEGTFLLFS